MVSTINGDANVPFYKELGNQGVKATDIPVVAFSVGEEELAGIDTKPLVGHLAAWNYFQSVDTPNNEEFIDKWQTFIKNDKRVTNDPMEAHVIGFNMWVKAVEKAGTTDPDEVIDAMIGVTVPNLTGGISAMLPNHHITKPVLIGEIQADGQFDVVWKTTGLVPGDAWSPHLEGSKDLIADWVKLEVRQLQRQDRQVRRRNDAVRSPDADDRQAAACCRLPPRLGMPGSMPMRASCVGCVAILIAARLLPCRAAAARRAELRRGARALCRRQLSPTPKRRSTPWPRAAIRARVA